MAPLMFWVLGGLKLRRHRSDSKEPTVLIIVIISKRDWEVRGVGVSLSLDCWVGGEVLPGTFNLNLKFFSLGFTPRDWGV